MPPFDSLGVVSYSTSIAKSLWPYLAPFPRYTDLLVKNRPIFSHPLVFGATVRGEAVGIEQPPSVLKNWNDEAIR